MATDPNPNSENGDKERIEQQKRVADDDNKSQNATIARIQQWRDKIADCREFMAENRATQEVPQDELRAMYFELAQGYLQQLRPYLTDYETFPHGRYFWEGYLADDIEDADNVLQLGTITVDPPEAIQQPSRDELSGAIRHHDRQTLARARPRQSVDEISYSVIGLKDFAVAEFEWEEQWSVRFGPEYSAGDLRQEIDDPRVKVVQGSRREPITVIRRVQMPRSIIDNAITSLEDFVRKIGMDVEFDTDGLPTDDI